MIELKELRERIRTGERELALCEQRNLILSILLYLANIRDGAYDYETRAIGKPPIRPDDSEAIALLEEALTTNKSATISEATMKLLGVADKLARDGHNIMSGHYRYLGRSLATREMT